MKDKILALIKDNKANVALFVSVLVASAVLFKLSFVYKDQTEKLKQQKEKIKLLNQKQKSYVMKVVLVWKD